MFLSVFSNKFNLHFSSCWAMWISMPACRYLDTSSTAIPQTLSNLHALTIISNGFFFGLCLHRHSMKFITFQFITNSVWVNFFQQIALTRIYDWNWRFFDQQMIFEFPPSTHNNSNQYPWKADLWRFQCHLFNINHLSDDGKQRIVLFCQAKKFTLLRKMVYFCNESLVAVMKIERSSR